MQLKANVRAVQSTPIFSRSGTLPGMFPDGQETARAADELFAML